MNYTNKVYISLIFTRWLKDMCSRFNVDKDTILSFIYDNNMSILSLDDNNIDDIMFIVRDKILKEAA